MIAVVCDLKAAKLGLVGVLTRVIPQGRVDFAWHENLKEAARQQERMANNNKGKTVARISRTRTRTCRDPNQDIVTLSTTIQEMAIQSERCCVGAVIWSENIHG